MFEAMLQWYREYAPHHKATAWRVDRSAEADVIRSYLPCGIHGVDRRGARVYYARGGDTDLAGIIRAAGYERLVVSASASLELRLTILPTFS